MIRSINVVPVRGCPRTNMGASESNPSPSLTHPASNWFSKAVDGRPKHPPNMLSLANNLIYTGEIDTAIGLLEGIVAIQPNHPQAHWSLAGAQKATDDAHIEMMRCHLSTPGMDPRAQAFYLYGIGKEYEDLERWDEAFEAFRNGAAARRSTVEYDEPGEAEMFRFLENHFDADWVNVGEGFASDAPIFVLGQPRTGTTLIERIISSHSMVHSAGELQQFGLAIRRLSNHQDPRRFSVEFFEASRTLDARKIGGLYLDSSQRMRGDSPRFVDKLPQNYLMIPHILKALPGAKIVHLTRKPMDACFSSFKQLFADAYLHSYDLLEMARHHVRYLKLMEVWRERFPGRFLDLSYEETVQDLEPNARRLMDHLELPWEDACLEFHQQKQAVSTASAVQVREPAHTRSIDRWKRYETQLQPLREELHRHGVETH